MARLILVGMLFVAAVPCAISDQYSDTGLTRESQLKAAFLWNFAKFVKWPADENKNTDSSLSFCLIGVTAVDLALVQQPASSTNNVAVYISDSCVEQA